MATEVVRRVKLQFIVEGEQKVKAAAEATEKAVKKVDAAAGAAGAGGLGRLNTVVTAAADRFKRATTAVEGIASSLGRALGAVGLVVGAFTLLSSAAMAVANAVGMSSDRFKVLTEESVKARTGLTNLTSSIDAYARSLGLANADLLTFGERQRALAQINNGGGVQNFDVIGQRAEKLRQELGEAETVASAPAIAGTPLQARLQRKADGLRAEVETLERSQVAIRRNQENERNAASRFVQGLAMDGGAGTDETKGRKKPKAGGAGGADPWQARQQEMAQARVDLLTAQSRESLGGSASYFEARAAARERERASINAMRRRGEDPNDAARFPTGEKGAAEMAAGSEASMQRISETAMQFTDAFASSAASAILFGESLKKGVNTALKALAQLYAVKALGSLGEAAILSFTNPAGAVKALEGAALYSAAAVMASAGAAATGGLRSGGGGGGAGAGASPSRGDFRERPQQRDQQPQQITVVIGGKAINDSVVAYSRGASASRSQPRVAVVQG